MKPRLLIVSYLARQDPPSPRAERTQMIVRALRGDWDIVLLAGPSSASSVVPAPGVNSAARRTVARTARALMLDRYELWSWKAMRGMSNGIDGAVLIGFPFSPVAVAAQVLSRREVPYVIDVGDPWVLTARQPPNGFIGIRRARRMERRMWEHARGAIVTTFEQRSALVQYVPDLNVLVRPNGFVPISPPPPVTNTAASDDVLRLVHFGLVSNARIGVHSFFERLTLSRMWRRIELHVYGPDWSGGLRNLPAGVSVSHHAPRPWAEAVRESSRYAAALVIGNEDPGQLPSKVTSYLTLPRPRIAVVANGRDSAIRRYLSDKPGWLVVDADDHDLPSKVARHVGSPWTADDLSPPLREAWPEVAAEIAAYINSRLLASRS